MPKATAMLEINDFSKFYKNNIVRDWSEVKVISVFRKENILRVLCQIRQETSLQWGFFSRIMENQSVELSWYSLVVATAKRLLTDCKDVSYIFF